MIIIIIITLSITTIIIIRTVIIITEHSLGDYTFTVWCAGKSIWWALWSIYGDTCKS